MRPHHARVDNICVFPRRPQIGSPARGGGLDTGGEKVRTQGRAEATIFLTVRDTKRGRHVIVARSQPDIVSP